MTTSRNRQLNHISESRIARADAASKRRDKAEGSDLFHAAESVLAIPGLPERTEEEAAEAAKARAVEVRRATSFAARLARDPGERDTFLQMLGLMPYESAQNDSYRWGRAVAAGETG